MIDKLYDNSYYWIHITKWDEWTIGHCVEGYRGTYAFDAAGYIDYIPVEDIDTAIYIKPPEEVEI